MELETLPVWSMSESLMSTGPTAPKAWMTPWGSERFAALSFTAKQWRGQFVCYNVLSGSNLTVSAGLLFFLVQMPQLWRTLDC